MSHIEDATNLIKARYPYICIVTPEEERVEESICAIAAARGMAVVAWSFTEGFKILHNPKKTGFAVKEDPKMIDPVNALNTISTETFPDGDILYIMRDFHPFISDVRTCRRLRDLVPSLPMQRKCVIFLGPVLKIPQELDKDVSVLDWAYPDRSELMMVLHASIENCEGNDKFIPGLSATNEGKETIVDALCGLTRTEATNVLSKSLVSTRTYDLSVIMAEKRSMIRKSGILEYYDTQPQAVGGLDNLKTWLNKRRLAYTPAARKAGLPVPHGVLLVGVPGCGKSLSAKAVAANWGMPLIRLDVGKVFGSLVGQSEEAIRKALKTAEAAAPCVLWIDEIEKGFSGTGSSDRSDGGTSSRVFGTFITWMQEKTSSVFVIATANDVRGLPPELLRKGRFDEIFFVDLPTNEEKEVILGIHLKKNGINAGKIDIRKIAAACNGFSGAELEQVVIEGMYETFDGDGVNLTTDVLLGIAGVTVPLSATRPEQISAMKAWAAKGARAAAGVQKALVKQNKKQLIAE